jgi:hypothetical protein
MILFITHVSIKSSKHNLNLAIHPFLDGMYSEIINQTPLVLLILVLPFLSPEFYLIRTLSLSLSYQSHSLTSPLRTSSEFQQIVCFNGIDENF